MRPTARSVLLFGLLAACAPERAPSPGTPGPGPIAPGEGPDGGGQGTRGALVLPEADRTLDLPYLGPEVRHRIEIAVKPARLDVHLSVDTTASFGGEIDQLQRDLTSKVIGGLTSSAGEVAFGVSRLEDFPVAPFGSEGDAPFVLLTPITPDLGEIKSALSGLEPLGVGGDLPEAGYEALYQVATGAGYERDGVVYVEPFRGGGEGGVGFREGSLRVVVHATDAESHVPAEYDPIFPGTRGEEDVLAALHAVDARLVGIAGDEGARQALVRLALGTGAVVPPEGGACPTGVDGAPYPPVGGVCPLVFDVLPSGAGLSDALLDALSRLLDSVVYELVRGTHGEDRLGFVRRIEAAEAIVPDGTIDPTRVDLEEPVGVDDAFAGAHTGVTLAFDVVLQNTALPAQDYDQIFRVSVAVRGDDQTLAEETLRIRVPGEGAQQPLDDAGDGGRGPL
jgi:hypothetical protein